MLTAHRLGRARAAVAALVDVRRIRPLVQFNGRAPRIGDEREGAAIVLLPVGPIELDPGRFELLDERLQVRHVESDMVEDPPLSGDLRRVAFVEPQLRSRQVGDGRVVPAHARLRAERFHIPGLALRYRGFRQEEVEVLMLDWQLLALVLQNLDSQAVRRLDKGLIRPVVTSGEHRHARGLPRGNGVRDVWYRESY